MAKPVNKRLWTGPSGDTWITAVDTNTLSVTDKGIETIAVQQRNGRVKWQSHPWPRMSTRLKAYLFFCEHVAWRNG